MRKFFTQCLNWLMRLLLTKTVLILSILFSLGVSIALLNMQYLSTKLIEFHALENVKLYTQSIQTAVTLYSRHVVNHIKELDGIKVTHDYIDQKGAIPLPASYSMELGKQISQDNPGMSVRLYSDYPFPWRKAEGGPKDEFEKVALEYLRNHSQEDYFRFEKLNNRKVLRYAKASVMGPSCVQCHNSYPESPKVDWQVGDIRGVLEITQPLDIYINETEKGLKGTFLMLGGISLLAISGLTLVISRFRQTTQLLEFIVENRTAELQKKTSELESKSNDLTLANERLERQANLDGLTQVRNRRSFDDCLNREWKRCRREQLPLSLILCDVDYFKRFNDCYGHRPGDNCLIQVARVISESVRRPADFVARYGGEEFVVILPNTKAKGAIHLAEAIRQNLSVLKIPHRKSDISEFVTLSLGVASIIPPFPVNQPTILVEIADKALYMAKEQGRDRVIYQSIAKNIKQD